MADNSNVARRVGRPRVVRAMVALWLAMAIGGCSRLACGAPLTGQELLVSCLKIAPGKMSGGVYAVGRDGKPALVAPLGREAVWNRGHTAFAYRIGVEVRLRLRNGIDRRLYDWASLGQRTLGINPVVDRSLVWSHDGAYLLQWCDSPRSWTAPGAPTEEHGVPLPTWKARIRASVLAVNDEYAGSWQLAEENEPEMSCGAVAAGSDGSAYWLGSALYPARQPEPARVFRSAWRGAQAVEVRAALPADGAPAALAADPAHSRLAVDVELTELHRRTYVLDTGSGQCQPLPFEGTQRCRMYAQEWSPDGTALLVVVETDVSTEPYLFSVAPGAPPRVLPRLAGIKCPHQMVWSADGNGVAVLAGLWPLTGESVYREVKTYRRDGTAEPGFVVDLPDYLYIESIDW